jgi:hypothetical protein
MTTRTIVTSQPDVACEVCERRLLRGEQPDVFVAAGRRLVVCELCAPRAAHEGWLRETESALVELPPTRPRRGRSLLDRLRQAGGGLSGERPAPGGDRRGTAGADAPYSLEDPAVAPFDGVAAFDGEAGTPAPYPGGEGPAPELVQAAPASWPEQGLAAFNASEFPRRVAGVARSLGAPEVSVRSAEHLESVIVIVVAWELCWYRYEVDLSEGIPVTRVLEQGAELGELPHDDRLANAQARKDGMLALRAA